MSNIINILQIVFGITLIGFILIQTQGAGLGSSFGGSGSQYHTKRGAEKIIFGLTVLTAVLFLTVSVLSVVGN